MKLFDKLRKKEEHSMADPKIADPGTGGDPPAGDPKLPTLSVPEGHVIIPQSELDTIRTRLDTFERNAGQLAEPQNIAPTGPTLDEQLATIDTSIVKLDEQIDQAVIDGKAISALNRERDKLTGQKNKLYTDDQVAAFTSQGTEVIAQLSTKVMAGEMPHLTNANVATAYKENLAKMAPAIRMNPEAQKAAYNLALGANMETILAEQKEVILRDGSNPPADPPGGTGKRIEGEGGDPGGGGGDTAPTFEEHFGTDSMAALRMAGKSPESEARAWGFADVDSYMAFINEQAKEEQAK